MARTVADRTEPRHLDFDFGHPLLNDVAFERAIVRRHHRCDAREGLDLLSLFGQRLSDSRLPPGAKVGAQTERAERGEGERDDHCRRHQPGMPADPLVELVQDTGRTSGDGLAVEESSEVF